MTTRPWKARLITAWWFIAVLISGTVVLITLDRTTERFDNLIYDLLLRVDRASTTDSILLVTIDDESLGRVGRWPWPRSTHAQLIDALTKAKPRAIAYDVLFPEPSVAADDAQLGDAIAHAQSVFVPLSFVAPGQNGAPVQALLPIAPVSKAARGIGHVNLDVDADGRVRRTVLAYNDGEQIWDHMMALVRMRHNATADAGLPSAERQSPLLIPFSGTAGHWPSVPAAAVLNGEVPAEVLHDRLIIVGATAQTLGDYHLVPTGGLMAGAEIQAHLLAGLLSGRMISVPGLAPLLGFGLIPVWTALLAFRRFPLPAVLPVLAAIILMVLLTSAIILLFARVWLPPGAPLAGLCISYPLWAWRQLASADSFMRAELMRFKKEATFLPNETPEAGRGGEIDSVIDSLGQAISNARELRRFTADSFDQLPDATLVTDMAGRVTMSNAAATTLFVSFMIPETERLNVEPLLTHFREGPHDGPLVFPMETAQFDPSLQQREREAVTDDGRVFTIRSAAQVSSDGTQTGWILRFVDVSEAKAAQRQRETIIQLLTHDMRSPQASILAVLETADSAQVDDMIAGRIRHYAQRTLGLADGFVQLARAEALAYTLEEVNLSDVLVDAIDDLWPQMTAKSIRVETSGQDALLLVLGERSLLTQVLVNIIGNAVKYSEEGTCITCVLSERQAQGGKPIAACSIADEGPGIAPEHRQVIFERFQRGTTSAGRKIPGAGLGLSLVHAVITRHKGEIECDSVPGRGSTFTILLPRVADNDRG